MRGKIFDIKKTTILRLSFIVNILFALLGAVLAIFLTSFSDLYFYIFCFFISLYLLTKSALFKINSACYFGNILLFISIFYFYCLILNLFYFYAFYLILSFAIASFVTHCIFDESYHLFLSISILFADFGLMLFLIKLISLPIFLAFILASVLLLIIRFLTIK